MAPPSRDPCVKFSCALEKCTTQNNFQADKCVRQMNDMLNCCRKYGPKQAPSCEGFHELDKDYQKLEETTKVNQ